MYSHCSVLTCEIDIVRPPHNVVRLELEYVKCLFCCHYLEICCSLLTVIKESKWQDGGVGGEKIEIKSLKI